MPTDRSSPALGRPFAAAVRTYTPDLIATLLLFVSAALMAGRVWRFPFDDELITLHLAESGRSAGELLRLFLGGLYVYPPIADLLFHSLHRAGLSEAGMRLCSLAMTAASLALMHGFTLTIIAGRTPAKVETATRLIAALLFGLSPLAIGVGDAIRWYPLFALLATLTLVLYLLGRNSIAARLGSAAALGLAASTSFLAAVLAVTLMVYRYALERQWRARVDVPYWLIAGVLASPGLICAYAIASKRLGGVLADQFSAGWLRSIATSVLGFFGGYAVGPSQAWVIVPAALITAWALWRAIDRTRPADPAHLLVLAFAMAALMVFSGFAKPRSFLYLAPVTAAVLTLLLDRWAKERRAGATMIAAALILSASVAAIANINHGTSPFKRNLGIPYDEALDFVRTNEAGSALIVSTDEVVVWVLDHDHTATQRCVSRFDYNAACFSVDRHYDSIIVISGHNDMSGRVRFMQRFETALHSVIAGRRKTAELHLGRDQDAALKRRLTGEPLDEFILTIELYR